MGAAILTESVMSWTCLVCVASVYLTSVANVFLLFFGLRGNQHGFAPGSSDWNTHTLKKVLFCSPFQGLCNDDYYAGYYFRFCLFSFMHVCVCVRVCACVHVCFCVHVHLSLCVFQMLMAYETFELGLHEERKQPKSLHDMMFDEKNMIDFTKLHWFFGRSHK